MARTSTTIYLVEHAATPGDGTPEEVLNGWRTTPITAAGRKALSSTASFLEDKNIGETYSSDLLRARQTASVLRAALDVQKPNTERRGLRPMDVGLLAGQTKSDVQEQLEDLKARRWALAPGGESYGKFLGRWAQELHRTIQEALGEEYACLYITHSHNLGALDHLLSGGKVRADLSGPVGPGGVVALDVRQSGRSVRAKPVFGATD